MARFSLRLKDHLYFCKVDSFSFKLQEKCGHSLYISIENWKLCAGLTLIDCQVRVLLKSDALVNCIVKKDYFFIRDFKSKYQMFTTCVVDVKEFQNFIFCAVEGYISISKSSMVENLIDKFEFWRNLIYDLKPLCVRNFRGWYCAYATTCDFSFKSNEIGLSFLYL